MAEALLDKRRKAPIERVIARAVEFIKTQGQERQVKSVLRAACDLVLAKSGKRRITIESARVLNRKQKKMIAGIGKMGDVMEERIDPRLIAGLRITIDGQLQWDGSLHKKLESIFT